MDTTHNKEDNSNNIEKKLSKQDVMEFIKHDTGKPMISLIEPEYVVGTAEVLTMGANKYSKGNWKNCEDTDRYKDAMLRHIYQYLNGETNDKESGLSHLYHVSCNAMFLDYFDRKVKDV